MCNHCDTTGVLTVEEYQAEEDDFCEWVPDDEEPGVEPVAYSCREKPEFIVNETYVDEHLCEYHARIAAEENEESDVFTEAIGLGTSSILPIEGDEPITCEYFDFLDPNAEECQSQARYATIVECELVFCKQHLEEYLGSRESTKPSIN